MVIQFACTQCGAKISCQENRAGTRFACPRCAVEDLVLTPQQSQAKIPPVIKPPPVAKPAPAANTLKPSATGEPSANPFEAPVTATGPAPARQLSGRHLINARRGANWTGIPATFIMSIAVLEVVAGLYYTFCILFMNRLYIVEIGGTFWNLTWILLILGTVGGLGILWNIVIFIGAFRMRSVSNYYFSMAICIMSLLPTGLLFILKAPLGAWGILLLMTPQVKNSFQAKAEGLRQQE